MWAVRLFFLPGRLLDGAADWLARREREFRNGR